MAYVKRNKRMDWTDAIVRVLAEEGGGPMSVEDITNKIIDKKYYCIDSNNTSKQSVNRYLSVNKDNLFERVRRGVYKLKGTPAPHTTASRVAPVVVSSCTSVRPCTSYHPGDAKYKCALDFVDSTVEKHADLSDLEMKLLELIVNFRLFLVNGEVCFAADILDNLEVQILDEEGKRPQSIDATLLQKKLNELNEQIAKTERELQNNPQFEKLYGLLKRMSSAAKEANERLNNASDGKVKFKYPILGEFIPGSNPKVVIYLKSIEKSIKKRKEEYPRRSESRWQVMAAVFVHEMFHAWNYVKAGRMKRSVLAIDEPMVEFETLYFLKELEAFTKSLSHHLHENWKSRVQDKQQSIGDVAAYGFGYYLFDKLSEIDADESIKWIETYSKKSASINGSYPLVEKAEKALNPVYPFKSESKVMGWFKKIIFDDRATSKTVGKPADAKVGSDVSLRDLVLACIKIIGRKCFAAQELYTFAPIFKVCVPQYQNLENALKQQLDELVNEGILDALPHDCYSMKLTGIEVKSKTPAPIPPSTLTPAPTKSKKARSIPFAVEFPADKVRFNEKTAVKTYIESLKHIGLSRVQSLGKMNGEYALVSNVEDPLNREKNLQHYVDGKYIYTKLGNQQKKGYLYEIAEELGISIKIYDV